MIVHLKKVAENDINENYHSFNSSYMIRLNKIYLFFKNLHLVNSNLVVCKLVTYLLGLSILLNALITVMFSMERAIAINFPLKMRNFRENYRKVFHLIIVLIILYSFLFPTYNIYLANVVSRPLTNETFVTQCDIPENYGKTYFNLTIIFVIQTLAFPFFLITVSNASILMAIYKNKQNFNGEQAASFKIKGGTKQSQKAKHSTSQKLIQSQGSKTSFKSRIRFNNSCRIGKSDKNAKLTRMLVAISLSFVLFHLPYFICWCVFVNFRLNNQMRPLPKEVLNQMIQLYRYLQFSEMLNLFNYSITGLLYFATGKIYRQHLYSILNTIYKCKKVDIQSSTYTYQTNN